MYIVQNDPLVPPGRIADALKTRRIDFRVVRLYDGDPLPPLEFSRPIVVLGGAMGAYDSASFPFLSPLKDFMRRAAVGDIPLLGICLGGQLLAAALGGEVRAGERGEKGLREITLTPEGRRDPLFAGFGPVLSTFQWHNDSFDLPPGAVLLASAASCPGQAFRFKRAYGLQFHPEVDEVIVETWVRKTNDDPEHLLSFRKNGERAARNAAALLGNFLHLARLL